MTNSGTGKFRRHHSLRETAKSARFLLGGSLLCLLITACSPKPTSQTTDITKAANCTSADTVASAYVRVIGGAIKLGKHPEYPEEQVGVTIHVDDLWFLNHEVTNEDFAEFVEATGYVTDAERTDPVTQRANGSAVFRFDTASGRVWHLDSGANWRSPSGDGSSIAGLEHHPVVHVSLADARAYADWANARLPTEVEWEYAAQSGLPNQESTSSGAYTASGEPTANTWQGVFPVSNAVTDGFSGTAPVGCYDESAVGLYDMIGNVWEWTETSTETKGLFTIKGGSFLCANNFCRRFRPQARQFQDIHFSSSHLGFRVVRDWPTE